MRIAVNVSAKDEKTRSDWHRKSKRRDVTISWIVDQVFDQLSDNPTEPIETIYLDFTPDV